jgi:FkbM family methyltransferase
VEGLERDTSVYIGGGHVLTRLYNGLKMLVSMKDRSLAPHLVLDGYWESWVTNTMLRHVKPGMRVLDVGAHFGYYTLLLAQAVGPQGFVWAFEPWPESALILKYNVDINGFLDRVAVQAVALGESASVGRLAVAAGDELGTWLGDASLVSEGPEQVPVTVVPLDELALGRIHWAKIDVEGAEYAVWRGGLRTLSGCDGIQLEWSAQRRYPGETFLDEISQAGFHIAAVMHDGTVQDVSREQLTRLSELWGHVDLLLTREVRGSSLEDRESPLEGGQPSKSPGF